MSLADELLADMEDDEEEEVDEEAAAAAADAMDTEQQDVKPDVNKIIEQDIKAKSIHQIAKLRNSDQLKNVMDSIEKYQKSNHMQTSIEGPVEQDPEYQLIVEANNLAVEIDTEIGLIHRFAVEKYMKRFPELESLVVSPLEYLRTIRELGNDLDRAKNNETLQQVITQATIMVVSVTASTTQGQLLSEEELSEVFQAVDMAFELNQFKTSILDYVESRMTFIAPNLSAIVGASIAAKMMGMAGGLSRLSKMPACNILLQGAQKKILSGFSQTATLPHTGFVYYSSFVQDQPPDMRRKAARLVAAKCALAARVDVTHDARDGSVGLALREDIERKMDKLTEPPPVKFVKPLPKPIESGRKRRGGKRVRKMKERFAITELRKQQNRLSFAQIEDDAYQEDLGYTRGNIGKAGAGRIRGPQVDEKTKVRISKTLAKNLQRQQVWGGSTTVKKQVSGTTSSIAFTPLQGLEIVNPQAAEKSTGEAGAKYFSNTAGFVKVNH